MGWLPSLEISDYSSVILASCQMDDVRFDCGFAADVLGDFDCFGVAVHEILPGAALDQDSNLK